jgi:ATP-dependent Clp protease ATP-binding subunit ClpC
VDFKNTVLIMTSNIGVRQLKNTSKYGFADAVSDDSFTNIKSKINEELRRAFNPEFLNRVDDFVFFHPLTTDHAKNIVDLALQDVSKKLKHQDIRFELSDGAKKMIAEQGFDPQYGARPLKRAIQKLVEDPIADELLKGTFSEGSIIKIDVKDNTELAFTEIGVKKNKARDMEIQ